jgi:two-component system nitrogen regulation response regulator GlnG
VRELQSVIKYAVVHCVGRVITPESLPESVCGIRRASDRELVDEELAGVAQQVRRRLAAGESDIYPHLINEIDRIALRETLRQTQGNQVHASERLGMSRTTLRNKIRTLGVDEDNPESR